MNEREVKKEKGELFKQKYEEKNNKKKKNKIQGVSCAINVPGCLRLPLSYCLSSCATLFTNPFFFTFFFFVICLSFHFSYSLIIDF